MCACICQVLSFYIEALSTHFRSPLEEFGGDAKKEREGEGEQEREVVMVKRNKKCRFNIRQLFSPHSFVFEVLFFLASLHFSCADDKEEGKRIPSGNFI